MGCIAQLVPSQESRSDRPLGVSRCGVAVTDCDSVRPGRRRILPSHPFTPSPTYTPHPLTLQPCVPGDRQKLSSWNGNGHVTAAAVHTCLCLKPFSLTFPTPSPPPPANPPRLVEGAPEGGGAGGELEGAGGGNHWKV